MCFVCVSVCVVLCVGAVRACCFRAMRLFSWLCMSVVEVAFAMGVIAFTCVWCLLCGWLFVVCCLCVAFGV